MKSLQHTPTARAARLHRASGSRRVVMRVVSAVESSPGTGTVASNGADLAAKRAQLQIGIFSAKPYVKKFLQEPLQTAGFDSAKFISVSQPAYPPTQQQSTLHDQQSTPHHISCCKVTPNSI
jgi:hypothetical protein